MQVGSDTTTTDFGPVIGAIRSVNKVLHYVAGAVLIALLLIIVANVVGRHLFSPPKTVPGVSEITELAMVVMIYLGFGYAEFHGDHITVDLLYERFKKVGQAVLSVISGVISLAVVYLVVTRLAWWAGRLAAGAYETQSLRVPMAPVAWIGVAGASFYLLAVACTTYLAIRGKKTVDSQVESI